MNTLETHVMRTDFVEAGYDPLREQLSAFWSIESVHDPKTDVLNQFKRDIYFNGDRYVTKLPFKPEHDMIPDNYKPSENRALALKKCPSSKPELLESCNQIFKDYKNQGIIEEVFEESAPVHL